MFKHNTSSSAHNGTKSTIQIYFVLGDASKQRKSILCVSASSWLYLKQLIWLETAKGKFFLYIFFFTARNLVIFICNILRNHVPLFNQVSWWMRKWNMQIFSKYNVQYHPFYSFRYIVNVLNNNAFVQWGQDTN